MDLLDNVIQKYDWGSRRAIAELQGRGVPSSEPEAELWMGAHPAAPSRLRGSGQSLPELLDRVAEEVLGAPVRARFGGFPFLLKVLAAEQPLSIQAHPSKAQAEAGYADEEGRGIARGAADRNYKDANHKPELLCALTRFEALCGFRSASEITGLFDLLALPELSAERAAVASRGAPDGIREAFRSLMGRTDGARDHLVAAAREACALHAYGTSPFAAAFSWSLRLSELYPRDVGAVSALLLNHVVLEPGQAIYLGAGNLHAYLSGVGVEIMASSDNVLRGGLTSKHVDVAELLRVLDFSAGGPVAPVAMDAGARGESIYRTPAHDFQLSRVEVSAAAPFATASEIVGPEILLCIEGRVLARSGSNDAAVTLARGDAALVRASEKRFTLEGDAVVFRASVGTLG